MFFDLEPFRSDDSTASLTTCFDLFPAGCGTIASAIATSLATPEHAGHLAGGAGVSLTSICVTRRSEARSSALAAAFPGVVTVCDTPAEVLASSDLVFLCVLPQHVDGVMDEVRDAWDGSRHTLVSLVSKSPRLCVRASSSALTRIIETMKARAASGDSCRRRDWTRGGFTR